MLLEHINVKEMAMFAGTLMDPTDAVVPEDTSKERAFAKV